MNEQQSALAYARAYHLFSQVFRYGLNDELATILGVDSGDSHYGAEHYQLFIHNVFPYAAIFLGEEGLLGGTITENVSAFYHRIGFQPTSDDSPDHLSTELDAMAYLSYAELDAVEDQLPHQVQRLRQFQRRFLDDYLLRWLPAFVIAVEQQSPNTYTALVRHAFELVCRHRLQLGDDLMASDSYFVLPEIPNLLADDKTSLRDIARFLLTPAYTGFFLSVDDIRRIGATYRVPHGFGKRQQILTNLLRTASMYEVFPTIIGDFEQLSERWQAQFSAMTVLPENIQTVWLERLAVTGTMLTKIEQLARQRMIIAEDTHHDPID